MSDAVKKYERVLQTGSQQRSGSNFRRACELVRNGRIASSTPCAWACQPGGPTTGNPLIAKKPEKVPEGFEYDLWLGPAPKAEYAPARCHVNFRWIYDYSADR